MIDAQSRRAARNFATSWKKWLCALKKKDRRAPKSSGDKPAAVAAGLSPDDFGARLSFFFNAHNHFFQEVAKYRAARKALGVDHA